jgi:hypothetical protein
MSLLLLTALWMPPAFADPGRPASSIGIAAETGDFRPGAFGAGGRNVSVFSAECMPGYAFDSAWLLGLNLRGGKVLQQTPVAAAGGTNANATAFTAGLGLEGPLNDKWLLSAAVSFIGDYSYDQMASLGGRVRLEHPLEARLKAGYFFPASGMSVDFIFDYGTWQDVRVAGLHVDGQATQMSAGIGLTFHFGRNGVESAPAPTVATPASAPRKPDFISDPYAPSPAEVWSQDPPRGAQ